MAIRYFVAALPPADYVDRINRFLEKEVPEILWPHTEPHVKIKTQEGLDPSLEWVPVVSTIASQTKPFTVQIGKPTQIGSNIIGLSIEAPELLEMHKKLVAALAPDPSVPGADPDSYFERESFFTPYITISLGLFESDRTVRNIIKKAEQTLAPFPSFEVTEVSLFEAVVFGESTYEKTKTIPLGLGSGTTGTSLNPTTSPATN